MSCIRYRTRPSDLSRTYSERLRYSRSHISIHCANSAVAATVVPIVAETIATTTSATAAGRCCAVGCDVIRLYVKREGKMKPMM